MDRELLNLLSVRRGHYRFESGYHGDLWLDLDQLFLQPAALRPFVDALAVRLARHKIQAVCGPLVGGALLAQMIAATLEVEFYYTVPFQPAMAPDHESVNYRLAHGLQGTIRSRRCAVVDDAINAGSAVRGTLAELRSCAAAPVAVGALVTLGETGAKLLAAENLPLECLATLPNQLWTPAECALCAAGVPLEDGRQAATAVP